MKEDLEQSIKDKWIDAGIIDSEIEDCKSIEDYGVPILNMEKIFGKFKESPFKVGEYRLLPKNTFVWCIDAQTRMCFEEDQIIEVTSTTCHGDLFFGKLKQCLFNIPGHIPTLIDKGKIEIETVFSKTTDYEVPKPQIITYNYGK